MWNLKIISLFIKLSSSLTLYPQIICSVIPYPYNPQQGLIVDFETTGKRKCIEQIKSSRYKGFNAVLNHCCTYRLHIVIF